MMSLVATPLVTARVTAPTKRGAVSRTVKASAASNGVANAALSAAVSLALVAQPALAASDMANVFQVTSSTPRELFVVADASDDKKAASAALAASLKSDLATAQNAKGLQSDGSASKNKVKNLADGGFSFSLPSLPSLGGGDSSKAPDVMKVKEAAPYEEGNKVLIPALLVLFSPLVLVQLISLQTLTRVVPQAAAGKDFFTKDKMPF